MLGQPFIIDQVIKPINVDPTVTKGARGNTPVAYPLLSKDENGFSRNAIGATDQSLVCWDTAKVLRTLTLL